MSKPIVRMVTVEPLKWVYFNEMGAAPELKALETLSAWAGPRGLLGDPSRAFIFGRNNPPPAPGKVEYGYDAGVMVDPEYELESGLHSVTFPRRSYAVVRAKITNIVEMWAALHSWVESNNYSAAGPGMEEFLTPIEEADPESMVLDLWLPIGGAAGEVE